MLINDIIAPFPGAEETLVVASLLVLLFTVASHLFSFSLTRKSTIISVILAIAITVGSAIFSYTSNEMAIDPLEGESGYTLVRRDVAWPIAYLTIYTIDSGEIQSWDFHPHLLLASILMSIALVAPHVATYMGSSKDRRKQVTFTLVTLALTYSVSIYFSLS